MGLWLERSSIRGKDQLISPSVRRCDRVETAERWIRTIEPVVLVGITPHVQPLVQAYLG